MTYSVAFNIVATAFIVLAIFHMIGLSTLHQAGGGIVTKIVAMLSMTVIIIGLLHLMLGDEQVPYVAGFLVLAWMIVLLQAGNLILPKKSNHVSNP